MRAAQMNFAQLQASRFPCTSHAEAVLAIPQEISAHPPFSHVRHHRPQHHYAALRAPLGVAARYRDQTVQRGSVGCSADINWPPFGKQACGSTPASCSSASFSSSGAQGPKVVRIPRAKGADFENSREEPGRLFCFGFGYTTLGLANALRKEGWGITGTCRSEEKREALRAKGCPAVIFDTDGEIEGLESDGLAALRSATHLIASIPPVGDFDQDPALAIHADQIREAARHRLKWIGYLSTTGVYGDWDGAWVDESTTPHPSSARAAARLRAEEAWLSIGREAAIPVCVFRLGGIYGPSRSALDVVRSARPASRTQRVRESRRFTSRCHVADIVQVVTSAMRQHTVGGRVYNVVDDDPSTRRDVVAYAKTLIEQEIAPEGERERPGISDASISKQQSSVYGDEGGSQRLDKQSAAVETNARTKSEAIVHDRPASNLESELEHRDAGKSDLAAEQELGSGRMKVVDEKRVRNDRIKQELGVTLLFPSYKEGLAAIARGNFRPFDEPFGN